MAAAIAAGPLKAMAIPLLMAAFFAILMHSVSYLTAISGLDQSWHLMLNHAYLAHYQHGRDIIFNYGPLSFLVSAFFDPDIELLRGILRSWYYGALALCLAHVLRIDSFLKAGLACLLFLPLVSFQDIHLLVPSLLLAYHEIARKPGDRRAAAFSALLGLEMAYMSLIKSPGFFFAVPVLLLVTFYRFSLRDRLPVAFIFYLGGTSVLLRVAGQDFSALADFYLGYLDISRAYNADMNLPASGTVQLLYAAAGLLLLASVPLKTSAGRLLAVVLLGYLLVVYKINFVRHGAIPQIAIAGLAVPLFFQTCLPEWRRPFRGVGPLLASLAAAAAITTSHLDHPFWPDGTAFAFYGDSMRHSLLAITAPEQLRAFYQDNQEAEIARVRAALPFKSVEGPIDVFPFEFSQAYASGLEIASRPAFQAYFATSRLLTERNAAFLESPQAPRSILFTIAPMDLRYPTLEDPLTFRAYRRLYRLKDAQAGTLLLERRDRPLIEQEDCLDSITTFGQTVPLPPIGPAEAIWLRIGLTPTVMGSAAGLILTPPDLKISVATAGGWQDYRYLREAGEVGFLLSPALLSVERAAHFYAGEATAQETAAGFRLVAPENSVPFDWYETAIPITVCRLSWHTESQ